MPNFTQLSYQERIDIYRKISERKSIRKIAEELGRHASTISREIKKCGGIVRYRVAESERILRERRNSYPRKKIVRNPYLEMFIKEKLKLKWSPDVIAGRWNKDNPMQTITHETIYKWIYSKENRSQELYKLLPRSRKKRGVRKQKKVKKIDSHLSIHQRPKHIDYRDEIGHMESDLVFHAGNQSTNILTTIERKSRFTILIKNENKKAAVVQNSLNQIKKSYDWIKSITFDRGSEFVGYSDPDIKSYFCDPGSPWQKGSIENLNGILRQHLPFEENILLVSQQKLDQISFALNTTPRKILNYLTPLEALNSHFKEKIQCVAFQV